MRIAVVGLGKLGAPLAAVLASAGHEVFGVDRNPGFVADLNAGRAPVREPRLQEFIDRADGRLRALSKVGEAVEAADATMVIVPTPSGADGSFSNRFVLEAISEIGGALRGRDTPHLVNIVSTVMPGSCDGEIREALEAASGRQVGSGLSLCYNPEFIALGSVINDMLRPDLVLIGQSDEAGGEALERIHRSYLENEPAVQRMSLINAEIAKISINAYVTMKISFANGLAEICEALPGADAAVVGAAVGKDRRIGGAYMRGALGFGGPCFPRDGRAFMRLADTVGGRANLAEATQAINDRQVARIISRMDRLAPEGPVAVLGLAYKPDTPVIEESQGVGIALGLAQQGRVVRVHDPLVEPSDARHALGDEVLVCATLEEALAGAAGVVVATAADAYHNLSSELGAPAVPVVVLDCWGRVLDAPSLEVHRIGRNGAGR